MKISRRAFLARACTGLTAATLTPPAVAQGGGTIGIALPTRSSRRWILDGDCMARQFEAAGYQVDLQYADGDVPTQLNQVERMVTSGVKALVIAAVEGTAWATALANARAAGMKVFAYDRLIRQSPNVDYYVTFDLAEVGALQANSLVSGLKQRFPDAKPWNVELFGGAPDDTDAVFFYDGAMSVLQPRIDSGEIAIPSGQIGLDRVATLRWDRAVAQARMDRLLASTYGDTVLNGVLSPHDRLSIGILSSLKGAGYGSDDLKMPIVTGQNAELPSIMAIRAGEQYSTVFRDTRALAKATVGMVEAVLAGNPPMISLGRAEDNGVKVVPTYLQKPVTVDLTNYSAVLVESGFYAADQLK